MGYGKILGRVPGTVLETMRGNIGASLMVSRIMENKILFQKNIQEGRNELMKEIVRNMRKDEDHAKKENKEKERKKKGKEGKKKKKKKKKGKKENKGKKKK